MVSSKNIVLTYNSIDNVVVIRCPDNWPIVRLILHILSGIACTDLLIIPKQVGAVLQLPLA